MLTPTVKIRTGGISTGNIADAETPSGTIDGSNTSFTLANTPSPTSSLQLFYNGQLLTSGSGNDFTLSGTTITMSFAPETGSTLLAYYRY